LELEEKFSLPTLILDASTCSQLQSDGVAQPFLADGIVIDLLNTFQLGEAMKNLLKGLARYPAAPARAELYG
jgi:hypothetical protein